jgi:hypothetical protein
MLSNQDDVNVLPGRTGNERLLTPEHRAQIEAACSQTSKLIAENDRRLEEARRLLDQIRAATRPAFF